MSRFQYFKFKALKSIVSLLQPSLNKLTEECKHTYPSGKSALSQHPLCELYRECLICSKTIESEEVTNVWSEYYKLDGFTEHQSEESI